MKHANRWKIEKMKELGYCRSQRTRICDEYDNEHCERTCRYAQLRQIQEQVKSGGLEDEVE